MTTLFLSHCNHGVGTPVAPEVKTAVSPTLTVMLVGCGVITGGTITVSVALFVVIQALLLAITETVVPLRAYRTLVNVTLVLVAPATSTPLVCHCKVGYGLAMT